MKDMHGDVYRALTSVDERLAMLRHRVKDQIRKDLKYFRPDAARQLEAEIEKIDIIREKIEACL